VLEKVKMIRGDSSDYDLLIKWAKELPKENKKYILTFWNFKTIEIGNNKICLEKKNP
jgi:hypothetical protein